MKRSLPFALFAAAALAASAAEPVVLARFKSVEAGLADVRKVLDAVGQPMVSVMLESQARAALEQVGAPADAPILLALVPQPAKPFPEDFEDTAAVAAALASRRPHALICFPAEELAPALVEALADGTNLVTDADGWSKGAESDEPGAFRHRDGFVQIAMDAESRALAAPLLAYAPAVPEATFNLRIVEPARLQELKDSVDDDAVEAFLEDVVDALGLGDDAVAKCKALYDASQANAKDVETLDIAVRVDDAAGLVYDLRVAPRAGSAAAARLAAAPALDLAALPAVPAGAAAWGVAAGGADPMQNSAGLTRALRAFFEGPAPSGDTNATAQRAAAVRLLDANLAQLERQRGTAQYLTADTEGRPIFAAVARLTDAAVVPEQWAALRALLAAAPAVSTNGALTVRDVPGGHALDIDVAEALVAAARALEAVDLPDEDEDALFVDALDEDDEENADEEDDEEDEDENDEDDDVFDEAEAREIARKVAAVIGPTLSLRNVVSADGTLDTSVFGVKDAEPAAGPALDLAPVLALRALGSASAGARPFSAFRASLADLVKLAAPAVRKATGDKLPPGAAPFLDAPPALEFAGVTLVDDGAYEVVFSVPLQGIADCVKFGLASAGLPAPTGEDALFDDEGDEDDFDDADFDADFEDEKAAAPAEEAK